MVKAILMDFDGLIVNTEVEIFKVFRRWFSKYHNFLLTKEEFLICVGSDDDELFDYLDRKYDIKIDRTLFNKEVFEEVPLVCKSLDLRPGIIDLIKEIKDFNLKLALVTSSYRSKIIYHLTRLEIIDYFDVIITREDVKNVKPSPDLYLKALEVFNIKEDEALVFEDSYNGLLSASRANINSIAYPNEITKLSNLDLAYKIVEDMPNFNLKKVLDELGSII